MPGLFAALLNLAGLGEVTVVPSPSRIPFLEGEELQRGQCPQCYPWWSTRYTGCWAKCFLHFSLNLHNNLLWDSDSVSVASFCHCYTKSMKLNNGRKPQFKVLNYLEAQLNQTNQLNKNKQCVSLSVCSERWVLQNGIVSPPRSSTL